MIYYFAYGSNMDKDDLDAWCIKRGYPSINFFSLSPSKLKNFKLVFNYYSPSRGSGAANIMESQTDCVYGLLLEIDDHALKIIRTKEGYPNYYKEISVEVEKFNGEVIQNVKTYKVVSNKEKKTHQPPSKSYLNLIIKNARKYDFPLFYVKRLESILTKD